MVFQNNSHVEVEAQFVSAVFPRDMESALSLIFLSLRWIRDDASSISNGFLNLKQIHCCLKLFLHCLGPQPHSGATAIEKVYVASHHAIDIYELKTPLPVGLSCIAPLNADVLPPCTTACATCQEHCFEALKTLGVGVVQHMRSMQWFYLLNPDVFPDCTVDDDVSQTLQFVMALLEDAVRSQNHEEFLKNVECSTHVLLVP